MSDPDYADAITGNCRRLEPIATGVAAQLAPLQGIRAVLFDVYGTLLISASGDIGADAGDHRLLALDQTLQLFDVDRNCSLADGIEAFENSIASAHTCAREQGIEYPEVDIVAIWQTTLRAIGAGADAVDFRRFALEYEVRANPVWPMPGTAETLDQIAKRGLVLGIVSNAQYFTPLLFDPLLGKSLNDFGFVPELMYFSYEHQHAKPGNYLYRLAREQLESDGIAADQTLYVGNDMLNDVSAAASVGFRTALFAGDQRSLRWRNGDARVVGIQPDVVITELRQLGECLADSKQI